MMNNQMKTCLKKIENIDQFIRDALNAYHHDMAESKMYMRWLENRANREISDAYQALQIRIAVVEGWMQLLNYDERFVVENHLIEQLEWARVSFDFSERWKGEFSRTERTLVAYQASAMEKISRYITEHQHMHEEIFQHLL